MTSDVERPSVTQQASFGDDGGLETDETVETSFDDWGLDLPQQERESRLDQPTGSLMADTRPASESLDDGEQAQLVREGDEHQKRLDGSTQSEAEPVFESG